MTDLSGKRILLIAPRFFGYEVEIRNELARRNAVVDYLPDRPFDTPLMAAVTRVASSLVLPAVQRLYMHELERFSADHYDFILVISGQTLSTDMLLHLRREYPRARMVLYMWDSIANRPRSRRNLKHYDCSFSFDRNDAVRFGMTLRPLFFSPGFEYQPAPDFKYHLSFIGTMHTDRFAVIQQLRQKLDRSSKCYWYLYLQAPWVYQLYRLIKPYFRHSRPDEFRFAPLARATVHQVFADSLTILDIEHPRQNGLTMRTFETLGASKKLVTTNASVREYDFFNEQNICILDRSRPQLSKGFLESPYLPLDPVLYRKYSLAGWVDEVMSV